MVGKSIETEGRLVVDRGCVYGDEVSFVVMSMFGS
jgi:hypothetical protein